MTSAKSRTVLVTRPEPRLAETMEQIGGKGWTPIACPVLRMHEAQPLPVLKGEAIAITSAQALPALRYQPKDRLLLTVGEKTAHRARKAGFMRVEAAQGKRDALRDLCRTQGLSGEQISFVCGRGWQGQAYSHAIAAQLGADWVEGYRVERVSSLSKYAEEALMHHDVDAVMFYSAETVQSFLALCPEHLRAYLRTVRAVCLSEAIAQHTQPSLWRQVEYGDPVTCLGESP